MGQSSVLFRERILHGVALVGFHQAVGHWLRIVLFLTAVIRIESVISCTCFGWLIELLVASPGFLPNDANGIVGSY